MIRTLSDPRILGIAAVYIVVAALLFRSLFAGGSTKLRRETCMATMWMLLPFIPGPYLSCRCLQVC